MKRPGDEARYVGVESAFKLPPHTATHVATSDFQAELLSKLLLTYTALSKTGRNRPLVHTCEYATPTS